MAIYKKCNNEGKFICWVAKFYFKDWSGNRRQKKKEGFKTKMEAKAFEIEFMDKVNADSSMLFSSLVKHYYEYIDNRLKPTTIANKKVLIDLKLLPYFGSMPLNEIEPSTVMKWQNELIEQGYAETYLKSIHNQLSAIFNFAIKFYKHNSNPARICGSMGKKSADSMDFYTLEEFEQFISTFEEKPTSKLMMSIMFWSGIRLGELLALKPIDFNFRSNIMIVDENYQLVNGQGITQSTKTLSSNRSITLPSFLTLEIEEYIGKLHDLKPTDRIFTCSKSFLAYEMTRGAKRANLKRIRVHDLRHSHASLLIHLGASPLVIQHRLGHKHLSVTLDTYSHLYPNQDMEIANDLDDIYRKKHDKTK